MPHVLLVDNDSSMRRALTRTLQHAGFEVQAFVSAEELLAAGPVDPQACLVLDLDLPGASGIELKKVLDQAGCVRPTVFITPRLYVTTPKAMLSPPISAAAQTVNVPAPTNTAVTLATLLAPSA
jgi:FixJ family two-component response regulator